MPYYTNDRVQVGKSERIYGYRTSTQSSGEQPSPKNTCDIIITAYDPFDIDIDYRSKFVHVKVYYVNSHGRRKYKYETKSVPYPYYKFKKKSRTVREWRLLISAAMQVTTHINDSHMHKHMAKKLKFLSDRLKRIGKCRPRKHKPNSIQNECIHWLSEISGFDGDVKVSYPLTPTAYEDHVLNQHYRYRAIEQNSLAAIGFTGPLGSGDPAGLTALIHEKVLIGPLLRIKTLESQQALTSMLWPSSDDFASRDASPLVDLAEAASDGVFPLGPPPSATEAHGKMVKNVLDDKMLSALKESIDFAANSWLWTTLVLQPVISSAVGLAASVKANDILIDTYNDQVKDGKWHQGKNIRVYGKDPDAVAQCMGAPTELEYTVGTPVAPTAHYSSLKHIFHYKTWSTNASLVYKLDDVAAAHMNSSGMRLSSFFNRISTDLDKVLYNIVPLSFVTDWFTTEYSGKLNLEDKIYMPLSDWKLILSYHVDLELESQHAMYVWNSRVSRVFRTSYSTDCANPTSYVPPLLYRTIYETRPYTGKTTEYVGKKSYCLNTPAGWGMSEVTNVELLENKSEGTIYEHVGLYRRFVYKVTPAQSVDNYKSIVPCFDTEKYEPLSGGQQITMAALLWGLVT